MGGSGLGRALYGNAVEGTLKSVSALKEDVCLLCGLNEGLASVADFFQALAGANRCTPAG
ncbi:hypothetical protein X740_10835 [Mesorhizobium sp. LNHC221B00]|nr:hypothetical protein X740_10835 [Mesorhizobium sp. LNHC221B00]